VPGRASSSSAKVDASGGQQQAVRTDGRVKLEEWEGRDITCQGEETRAARPRTWRLASGRPRPRHGFQGLPFPAVDATAGEVAKAEATAVLLVCWSAGCVGICCVRARRYPCVAVWLYPTLIPFPHTKKTKNCAVQTDKRPRPRHQQKSSKCTCLTCRSHVNAKINSGPIGAGNAPTHTWPAGLARRLQRNKLIIS
jgi:hypothetical protein